MNDEIRDMLAYLREAKENIEKEAAEDINMDAVPYSAQDTLMTNVLASCKQEFGADFNGIKNPMLYYPNDGDITLSGVIPEMNDAKFQFRYKVGDGAGCYLWSNPYLPISDKTIQTIQKVNGVCKNWRDEISKSEDCKPSNYRDPNDVQDNIQGQVNGVNDDNGMVNTTMINNTVQEYHQRRGDDIIDSRQYMLPGDDID
jgi:hypothetical protein